MINLSEIVIVPYRYALRFQVVPTLVHLFQSLLDDGGILLSVDLTEDFPTSGSQ